MKIDTTTKGLIVKLRDLTLLLLLLVPLYAQKVEVSATRMHAMERKKEVHFTGSVHIKQGESWLRADSVVIHFDENNATNMYEATGHVSFRFKEEKSDYKGVAQKVIYYPLKSRYTLKGRVTIDDLLNHRTLKGEEILLDMKRGDASVKGNRKKPVKFIFDLGEKQ